MKHVPIVLISPVPVPRGKTKKNPRPKQHSEILTSTPFKEVLDEKDRKKRIKMEKANAAKTNLRISSETKENKMKTKNKMKGKQKKTPKIKVKNTKTKKRTREIISESDSDEESYDNDELCDDDELDDVSDAGKHAQYVVTSERTMKFGSDAHVVVFGPTKPAQVLKGRITTSAIFVLFNLIFNV
ncbi:hypothetical protein JTB14_008695 [Gonioctena quinquepunctata]|nr:hypothetical protein JTB14_008695 [Gonioctena quinquepunctata]